MTESIEVEYFTSNAGLRLSCILIRTHSSSGWKKTALEKLGQLAAQSRDDHGEERIPRLVQHGMIR
jgi:hypothetical protein